MKGLGLHFSFVAIGNHATRFGGGGTLMQGQMRTRFPPPPPLLQTFASWCDEPELDGPGAVLQ